MTAPCRTRSRWRWRLRSALAFPSRAANKPENPATPRSRRWHSKRRIGGGFPAREAQLSFGAALGNRFRLQPRAVLDDPRRTAFDLIVNAPEIFAQNAEADQLDAAKKQN